MAKLMAGSAFRSAMHRGKYDAHIAPINYLVDELGSGDESGGQWVPHVAPIHGGTKARVLALLSDPGPKTSKTSGSGMICFENDDPTAAMLGQLFDQVSIPLNETMIWNAHPWYRHGTANLRAADLRRGIDPLKRVIDLMPDVRAVVLFGSNAQKSWKYFAQAHPQTAQKVMGIHSPHPGTQALWSPDPQERERRLRRRIAAMREARDALDQPE
ncbi:uracil-DNA glycosylase [Paeniglutamicibacter sp. ORCA_105]|uniref:uracil-DNA glycosylase n=1 Tax=Paeniglutamicibacter sp. ORCA_105 TaxID=3377336 RepID=UPI003896B2F8